MGKVFNPDFQKQIVYVVSLACITALLSFSKLGAEEPAWKLVPDERNKTVWRVGSNGAISKIDFPVHHEKKRCRFCYFEIRPSPDQSKIAYLKRNDLWVYDMEKKKDQRCTNVGRPDNNEFASVYVSILTWSPDSKRILYSVLGGEIYNEPQDLKVRKAKYGRYLYDITKRTSCSAKGISGVWLQNGKFLLIKGDSPLLGEIYLYDPANQETRRIVQEHAWYGDPKISVDGRWALIGAGQTVGPDPDGSGKNLRSQLRKINLESGKFINITPLGGWGDYWSYDISLSGNSVAYFVKKRANPRPDDPNNYQGSVIVDGMEIYSSDLLAFIYWINNGTIVIVTSKELLVLDSRSGKVIGSHQR